MIALSGDKDSLCSTGVWFTETDYALRAIGIIII